MCSIVETSQVRPMRRMKFSYPDTRLRHFFNEVLFHFCTADPVEQYMNLYAIARPRG